MINPMQLLAQMQGNPLYNKIMPMVQGKNPQELEQYVRNLYQSQGVDINKVAQQFGIKL